MSEEMTKAVTSRWFQALNTGDLASALDCLDESVRWINSPAEEGKPGGIPGLSAIIPWLGDFSTRAAVAASFKVWASLSEVLKHEHLDMTIRDDQALVVVHEVARIKLTGLTYEIEFIQRLRVAHDSIVYLRAYWDTSRGVAAFRGNMAARLLDAVARGDSSAAELVLPFGANPNQTDPSSSDSVLMIAAARNDVRMLRTLLSYGAESNLIGRTSGCSALHRASESGSADSTKALLEAGAFVNIQCPVTGYTPLHGALKHGHLECAELLLRAGASKSIVAHDGKRPFDVAV